MRTLGAQLALNRKDRLKNTIVLNPRRDGHAAELYKNGKNCIFIVGTRYTFFATMKELKEYGFIMPLHHPIEV